MSSTIQDLSLLKKIIDDVITSEKQKPLKKDKEKVYSQNCWDLKTSLKSVGLYMFYDIEQGIIELRCYPWFDVDKFSKTYFKKLIESFKRKEQTELSKAEEVNKTEIENTHEEHIDITITQSNE